MAQTTALIKELKRTLKSKGMTYADVAIKLNMSEANIKRMFSEKRFYLGVFDEICQMAGFEISDLAKKVEKDSQSLEQLSEEQERELALDPKLLLLAFLTINGVSFDEIQSDCSFNQAETIRLLTRLDRLKLIELLPNNRVKLLIAPNFAWRHNGPIQQFFTQYLRQDFLSHTFNKEDETLHFVSSIITAQSRKTLINKIKQLITEFNQINHADTKEPYTQRQVTSMLLAIRPWKPKAFEKYQS